MNIVETTPQVVGEISREFSNLKDQSGARNSITFFLLALKQRNLIRMTSLIFIPAIYFMFFYQKGVPFCYWLKWILNVTLVYNSTLNAEEPFTLVI